MIPKVGPTIMYIVALSTYSISTCSHKRSCVVVHDTLEYSLLSLVE